MEIEEIAGNLNNTADICEDIIQNDKRGQMEALQRQIESLNNTISHKTDQINQLLAEMEGAKGKIQQFVDFLLSESKNEDRNELLSTIQSENNIEDKLDLLFKLVFIDYNHSKNDKDVISRMRTQLYGHVELLTHLNESKEYQEKFFNTDNEGNVCLSDETKNILNEQARHTTELLNSIKTEEAEQEKIGTIESVFANDFDGDSRVQQIKDFLAGTKVKAGEMIDLLIQETTITSILSKYIDNLIVCMTEMENDRQKDELHKSECEKRIKAVFEKLCDSLGTQSDYSFDQFLELTQALANDCLKARTKVGLKIGGFTAYLEKSDKALLKLAKKLEQAQNLLQRQTEELEKSKNNATNEWSKWGRNLYIALLGFGERADEETIRLTIETAALTSVGKIRKYNKNKY